MKKISALLASVMLLAVISACGDKNNDTQGAAATAAATTAVSASPKAEEKGKLADIKKAGKIVMGTSADYAPYEFHKPIEGKDMIVGFDIEIAKAIAADMGVTLEIKDMGFDGLLPALAAGNVDFVMSGMTPTEERKKNVDFSKVYYTAEQIVLVRADDKDKFKTIDDLKKASVGVQTASIQEGLAKEQLTGAKLKSIGKIPDLVLELKNKKIDALIMEKPVATGYTSKHPDVVISGLSLNADEAGSAAAVKKGNPELVAQIDKTLERLIKEKTIDQFVTEAYNLQGEQ